MAKATAKAEDKGKAAELLATVAGAKAEDKGKAAELLATVARATGKRQGQSSGIACNGCHLRRWQWLKQKTRAKQRNCLQRWLGLAATVAVAKAEDKGKATELLATVAGAGAKAADKGKAAELLATVARATGKRQGQSSGIACNGCHLRRWQWLKQQ